MRLPGAGPGVVRRTYVEHQVLYVRDKSCLKCGQAFATYAELLAHVQDCEPPPSVETRFSNTSEPFYGEGSK